MKQKPLSIIQGGKKLIPNIEVISLLKECLKLAKQGKIQSISIQYVDDENNGWMNEANLDAFHADLCDQHSFEIRMHYRELEED